MKRKNFNKLKQIGIKFTNQELSHFLKTKRNIKFLFEIILFFLLSIVYIYKKQQALSLFIKTKKLKKSLFKLSEIIIKNTKYYKIKKHPFGCFQFLSVKFECNWNTHRHSNRFSSLFSRCHFRKLRHNSFSFFF